MDVACHYMPHGVVDLVPGGYSIQMPMEGHPLAGVDILAVIPWQDKRVQQSPDEFYYICLDQNMVWALYVPEEKV